MCFVFFFFLRASFREFLTGFHKRKLAKAEAARKKAAEREKQDRLEARREVSCALVNHHLSLTSDCSNAASYENEPLRMLPKWRKHTAPLLTVRAITRLILQLIKRIIRRR